MLSFSLLDVFFFVVVVAVGCWLLLRMVDHVNHTTPKDSPGFLRILEGALNWMPKRILPESPAVFDLSMSSH